MPERPNVAMRLEPTTERRLTALAARLGLNRTAMVHLAIAKLAQAEGGDDDARERLW
jgi:predicted transcriptional regulator